MKPGITLTDQTKEIVSAYLEKQRKRYEERIAGRKAKTKDYEFYDSNYKKQ